jgi:alanine racemase
LVTPLLENADILAVSEIQEAQALRQITNKPILLLSGVHSREEKFWSDDCRSRKYKRVCSICVSIISLFETWLSKVRHLFLS